MPTATNRSGFCYSGLSYAQALEYKQALLTGQYGPRFPFVRDSKERADRIVVLNEILLEAHP